ncbi:MAG: hypothetical protein VB122_06370 [Erysipelotrichales bacterium]|nr:hypothetical protein [Erysipelotrichales bacterium]
MKNNFFYKLFWVFISVILLGLGGYLFVMANIGSDALTVFNQGVATFLNIDFGYGIIITNSILIIVMFFVRRDLISYGTFMSLLIGPIVNLFSSISLLVTPNSIYLKILMLVIGIIIAALGIAIYISMKLGLSPFESVVVAIQEKLKTHFRYVKIVFDAILFIIGYLLGGVVGFGSIIAIITIGPLVDLFILVFKKIKIFQY